MQMTCYLLRTYECHLKIQQKATSLCQGQHDAF
jgi:hypothetical protein